MSMTEAVAGVLQRTRELPNSLLSRVEFHEAVQSLEQGDRATFDGVWGSSCALLAATLGNSCPGSLVVVCPQIAGGDDFADGVDGLLGFEINFLGGADVGDFTSGDGDGAVFYNAEIVKIAASFGGIGMAGEQFGGVFN